MSDLRTLLHSAAGPIADPPTADVARADRARGDRALRRHRAARLAGGSGLVAVAVVGVFTITSLSTGVSTPSAPPTVASRTTESGPSTLTGTTLVSYTGAQPVGYTLDKIPAGWKVRHSNAGLLVLAPKGSVEPPPANAEQARVRHINLTGTVAVMTQSDVGVPTGIRLDKVTVGGRPAVIGHTGGPDDDARTLFAKQPSGVYLQIQVWDGLGWDNDTIVEFAESVHITKDAKQGVG
jgi:hypothetical protein